jgi:carboxyl-terminal processing protease
MKRSTFKLLFGVWALAIAASTISCEKDHPKTETQKVNEFIKEKMELYYYWNNQMPSTDITKETDPEAYFYSLLNKQYDKWSFISDDYQGLVDMLTGTEYSMGYSLQPLRYPTINSTDVVACVQYVEPNSPADKANIKRGDLLIKVDGTKLTIYNYYELISKPSYTATFGAITQQNQLVELTPSAKLAAKELHNDAVLLDTIYNVGSKKVGYMVYNTFTLDKTNSLDAALTKFKSENINELVLDMRYNGGGFDSLAIMLASAIGPSANVGKTMYNSTYNSMLTYLIKRDYPNDTEFFTTQFKTSQFNLNLQRLFVLTTESTASASELVMYSLSPYIDVVQIGVTTHGKYYGMAVLPCPDEEDGPWVILPIYTKATNADNSINYLTGLVPDHVMFDDYDHELGDKDELMLAKALSIINGNQINAAPGLKSARLNKSMHAIPGAQQKLNPYKNSLVVKNPRLPVAAE